uniref:Uncharacterized protein n=1 Tax=Anguilla anguilla TaxID=7936 RepID=A0A0E9QM27_ANGAN
MQELPLSMPQRPGPEFETESKP